MAEVVRTTSTSKNTASASPVVLRQNSRGRLIFRPTLISDNPKDADAYVRGVFVYQTKKPSESWEDHTPIKLNDLRTGEGVRLDLSSGEIHTLYQGLCDLYRIAAEQGLNVGHREFVEAPADPGARALVESGQFRQLSGSQKINIVSACLQWLSTTETEQLAKEAVVGEHAELLDFDAAIGAARLRAAEEQIRINIGNSDESFWQTFLRENSWVLSQLYAQPLLIIQEQAYLGGKAITNRGGNVADFLLRNDITHNPVVVEIKTPAANLLTTNAVRNTAYGPHGDVTAAVAQVDHARSVLKERYHHLAGDDVPKIRAFRPGALVIAGSLKAQGVTGSRAHSFELYRNGLRDVEVVTFDELHAKVTQLLALLHSSV